MVDALPFYDRIPSRALDGVLLLDKPIGPSSNEALLRVKRLLSVKKAGHTGTLDPLASGLLPLCFGEATKFAQHFLNADKTYEVKIRLGVRTITGDAEGYVIDRCPVTCNRSEVEIALSKFIGKITQIPPMYSALKRDGKRLYQYARAGCSVYREKRDVIIRNIEHIDYKLPNINFRVTCCKGTYIRTLAEDIGKVLGCGAYLTMLRRIGVGMLNVGLSVTLDALSNANNDAKRDSWLLPVDTLLSIFSRIQLDDSYTKRFLNGQRLKLEELQVDLKKDDECVRVYDHTMRLLGVGRVIDGLLRPERVISTSSIWN